MKINFKKLNFKKIIVLPMTLSYLIASSLSTVALSEIDVFKMEQMRVKINELVDSSFCNGTKLDDPFTTGDDEATAITLIDNAIDSIGKDGSIKIMYKKINDRFLLNIIDSGKGMKNDEKGKIFIPFYSTKEQSIRSGNGLPISKFLA
ncbi:hypothetical protein KY321_02015, partial [Candidatus Woesearchaeota archaeon]|nr:hypothetical protein [Candidatus Woesearchaeota archaeon]